MTIGLAGSLIDSSRFTQVELAGPIERVAITTQRDSLHVYAYDSSGHVVVDQQLTVELKRDAAQPRAVFKRRWRLPSSGETGAASGETVTTISKDGEGSLRIETVTVAARKGFFSSQNSVISRHWRIYPQVDQKPNQALQPTPVLVTPRADARVAPSTGVADL